MLVLPPPPLPPYFPSLSLSLSCFFVVVFFLFFFPLPAAGKDVMYNRKKYSILKIVNILSAEFIFELLE